METTKELTISNGTLSESDLDILSGMMIVFLRAAEKCMQTIELHYEAEYRAGTEYKQYRKPLAIIHFTKFRY